MGDILMALGVTLMKVAESVGYPFGALSVTDQAWRTGLADAVERRLNLLSAEAQGLRHVNDTLQRVNADLLRERDEVHREAEALRARVATLEAEAATLSGRAAPDLPSAPLTVPVTLSAADHALLCRVQDDVVKQGGDPIRADTLLRACLRLHAAQRSIFPNG